MRASSFPPEETVSVRVPLSNPFAGDGGQHPDPLLSERFLQLLRHVAIRPREELVLHLHHRDFGAERPVDVGELHPHRAAPKDDHGAGKRLLREGVVAGQDHPAVGLDPREPPHRRSGGHEDVLRRELLLPRPDGGGRENRRARGEQLDPVLLEEVRHAAGHPLRHLPASSYDGAVVRGKPLAPDPVRLGVAHILVQPCGGKDRLGRDAPPVDAHPAGLVAFGDRHAHPQLGRADRRHVASGPRSDHDQVELLHREILSVRSPTPRCAGRPRSGIASPLRRPRYGDRRRGSSTSSRGGRSPRRGPRAG